MTWYLDFKDDKEYIIEKSEETRFAIPDTIKNGEEILDTYTSILESYPLQLTACEIESI